eukprot:9876249-Alexandrium_andersonii.AAC.1
MAECPSHRACARAQPSNRRCTAQPHMSLEATAGHGATRACSPYSPSHEGSTVARRTQSRTSPPPVGGSTFASSLAS